MQPNKLKVPDLPVSKIRSVAINILTHEMKYEVWSQNNISVRGRKFIGRKGVGDIIGYCRSTGRMVQCENKTVNDRFSKEQIEMLTNLHKAGGIALYATQEGLKVVVKEFNDYLQQAKVA